MLSLLKLKNGQKKHLQNVVEIKHGFLKLVVIFLYFLQHFLPPKSCFNDFWMGDVKNRQDLLVHETVKSAIF